MSFDRLADISKDLLEETVSYTFVRDGIFKNLEPPKNNVIVLKGARGIGKSTLLKQFLFNKMQHGDRVLYISADSTLLNTSIAELALEYHKRGGLYLAIDEIHKCPGWQAQVKTILDSFSKIRLLISGSSSLSLDYAAADLSRRHIMLHAKGLSFLEYVQKQHKIHLPNCNLIDILQNAEEICRLAVKQLQQNNLDILELFSIYLKSGYFLSRENYATDKLYYNSLINSINSVIDSDISSVHTEVDNLGRSNIKMLLKHIANKCPFTPNIAELSRNLTISSDASLKKYLYYLSEGEVLTNLYSQNKSHKDFQKPQKIFLNNTNFAYAFSANPDIGTIRETYAANCLQTQGKLTAPNKGDFCLDDAWYFEVGGSSKNQRQIQFLQQGYVLADNILIPEKTKLPLWSLGLLW